MMYGYSLSDRYYRSTESGQRSAMAVLLDGNDVHSNYQTIEKSVDNFPTFPSICSKKGVNTHTHTHTHTHCATVHIYHLCARNIHNFLFKKYIPLIPTCKKVGINFEWVATIGKWRFHRLKSLLMNII
jgi:hypothetical protein